MKLSIIVPCYNESKNIPLILERFSLVIERNDVEVVLVNNGSTDNSREVLDELVPLYSFARQVSVEENQGYGFGILSGLSAAKGEFLGWTHADMQTDPHDPIKALELLESQPYPQRSYVKGTRQGRPLRDNIFTVGMSLFETLYMRCRLWDINAQPNIFHRSFFERWENPPHDFSLDLYVLYLAKYYGLQVVRFPVLFPERIHGESSWNTGFVQKWKFIHRTLEFSVKLKKGLGSM